MAISTPYKDLIRKRAIKDFIKTNLRSPSVVEIRQLVSDEEAAYPAVDQIGFSGFDIVPPQFIESSSAMVENQNRQALLDDMEALSNRLDDMLELLEDSHRGFYATVHRIGRKLIAQEGRIQNLYDMGSAADSFIHGFEETFDVQDKIDFSQSDCSVESGFVTLGRKGYTPVDLSKSKVTATALSAKGIVGQTGTSPVSALRADDGDIWEYLVYTKYAQGAVTLVVDVELPEEDYVGEVRISGLPIAVNKQATVTAFYSLDGTAYTIVEPVERVLVPEMAFGVGKSGVKKVQLRISKLAADTRTPSLNQHIYIFSLDSIRIYGDKFDDGLTSTMIAGPYSVTDESNNPVFFTKATLTACILKPPDTSINFFLSTDGTSWEAVGHTSASASFVSFGDGTANQSVSLIDAAADSGSLVELVTGIEEIDFQSEAVINSYVGTAFASKVPLSTFLVKRNIPYTGSPSNLLEAVAGWTFDDVKNQYSTTVYVSASEGRYLNLGPTSATVNGKLVTGKVFFPSGYSIFSTDDSNWISIAAGLNNLASLEQVDSLYPYNHRYLLEGYSYSNGFSGEEVYRGFDENFGSLLKYVAPEEFSFLSKSDPNYYNVFTIEDGDGNWYMKVKVNKSDSSWSSERYLTDWSVQSGTSDQIYVRAILNTSSDAISPMIDSFKVRVI